ncbi:extracellular solute-binding protein [Paenibacillus mesophilus]|uniref:extracellular solute-binding protein n=1 Tax=Paenibacillus mesophilus TaxID=2582849 RepID=UPI00110DECB1|nr:extracellular solute-binding protein [Paenibacillus mesophilus]TMV52710.1 extracellular solute-binding protein [Paenibacillus mesophilus]
MAPSTRWLSGLCSFVLILSLIASQSGYAQSVPGKQTAPDAKNETSPVRANATAVAGASPAGTVTEPKFGEAALAWSKQGIGNATATITVNAGQPSAVSDASQLATGDYAGKSRVLLWRASGKGWVEYTVNVPESALYEIRLSYRPLTESGGTGLILWEVTVDGERQFAESSSTALYRTWQDVRPILKNGDGDQIRPRSKDVSDWSVKPLVGSSGAYSEPLQWFFGKGSHTVRFTGAESVALETIQLAPRAPIAPYKEVNAAYPDTPAAAEAQTLTLQAEEFDSKNDTAIKLFSDRNPRSVPRAKGRITYNTAGGIRWVEQNQEITWSFEVPADGRYKIGFRALQNTVSQKTSFRTVRIDGKVPFQEFLAYGFPYSASWKGRVLEDTDGKPYSVYLKKGKHTLSLAVTHAPVEPVITELESISRSLDAIDWDLRSLVGAVVDRNRTWNIDQDFPGLTGKLEQTADRMERLAAHAIRINGNKDSISQGLDTAAKDIRSLLKKPEEIPYNVKEISSMRDKFSSFIETLLKQSLQLDEIYIAPLDGRLPTMEASLWSRVWGGLANFYYSFDSRDSIRKLDSGKLNIWVQRGRDYVDQLQQLADERFTPDTGIQVKVNLMANPELLLMSNAAGVQPDIALGLTQDLPVDFAIRGSLHNLAQFPDFPEFYKGFSPGSWLPLFYNGGYYGIPETQSFQVLFYRDDILKKLGIGVPQTWEDVYDLLPTLQQNYMNFYVNASQFSQYFYQNKVELYEPDGLKTALDKPEAFRAFKQWTDLFNTYAIEREVPSFYQHFRDGTMPIGISDYNMYVQLAAAAPELNDRWKIAAMPGVRQTDGTILRWAGGGQRTGVIFEKSDKKDEAWRFLKWWLSADIQQQYGADLEAVNGVAFRWNTSNVEAFTRLPWKREDAQVILNQWKWYKDIPNVPGGYFLEREANNAWIRTVVGTTNYRASLEQAVRDINRELRRKQEEFGFVDKGGNRLKPLQIPLVDRPWEGIDRYVD